MAIVYSDEYKKSYKTSEKTSLVGVFETPDARTLTAEMKVASFSLSGAPADEVFLGRLAANVTIRQVVCHGNAADVTINIRDLDETTVLLAGVAAASGVSTNVNYLAPNDVIVEATLVGAETNASVVVYYTEM